MTRVTDDTDDSTADDYIDPYSDYSLYDVVKGNIPAGQSTEYMGFHLTSQGSGIVHAILDGHAGCVETFRAGNYDDVLGLVDDLNTLVVRRHEYDYAGADREELCEWAGPILTDDEEKADGNDNYIFVPDDLEEPEF